MKDKYKVLLFLIVLILLSILYGYHRIAFKRPQSIHRWRQSDCASIALNYYQGGMKFLHPETHNLTSDGGTNGKCYTSEIPILYYSAAILYKLFGYHEFLYRIFNTLLFFLGLFFLFRIFNYLITDLFWSIGLSLLFFTSPVLVYYGNNFLSDSSALAFSIIGWFFFIRFIFEKKSAHFYFSIVLLFLAASFKISALFSLFALAGIFFLEQLKLIRFSKSQKLFHKPLK